jgi:hypothetical protein
LTINRTSGVLSNSTGSKCTLYWVSMQLAGRYTRQHTRTDAASQASANEQMVQPMLNRKACTAHCSGSEMGQVVRTLPTAVLLFLLLLLLLLRVY